LPNPNLGDPPTAALTIPVLTSVVGLGAALAVEMVTGMEASAQVGRAGREGSIAERPS
jgi:hypothetical protein